MKLKREPQIDGTIARIPLTQSMFALVDVEDLGLVSGHNWFAKAYGDQVYAARHARDQSGARHEQRMHRAILPPPPGMVIDHINGNGLDNRRKNLRLASKAQNAQNMKAVCGSSRFKGVYWSKHHSKWVSRIRSGGQTKVLGRFDTEEEAHKKYCLAALETFREFARFA